jgi:hypothetical protein
MDLKALLVVEHYCLMIAQRMILAGICPRSSPKNSSWFKKNRRFLSLDLSSPSDIVMSQRELCSCLKKNRRFFQDEIEDFSLSRDFIAFRLSLVVNDQ